MPIRLIHDSITREELADPYHSFINIRPRQGNRGIKVENPDLRNRMRNIILRKVPL